jgi:hypothetical protein
MRLSGRQARPADAASVKVLDEAGRAYLSIQPASVRIDGPVTPPLAKGGIAHQRFGEQADQFLAIDGFHSSSIH